MSIINWNLSPVRVELVTDTLAYDGNYCGLWNTTKFFTTSSRLPGRSAL